MRIISTEGRAALRSVRHVGRTFRIRIISAEAARLEHGVLGKWEELLQQSPGTTLMYQSPAYLNHLAKLRTDCAFLAVIECDKGTVIGVVPLRKSPVLLKFDARQWRIAKASFPGIRILGGTLLTPHAPEMFEALYREIARFFPNCAAIEMSGLSTTSLLWNVLQTSPALKQDFAVYAPHGPRNCHTALVPESFAEYLKQFGRKKSYNLKRQIRLLEAFGNGSLVLQRIDSVAGVEVFRNAWAALGGPASRDGDRELSDIELMDFAERGLLLNYVLSVNGKPCALAVGTLFKDTLVQHSFRHDLEMSRLSPGTVLQTLMMKDLAEHRLVRRIDYGFGEPQYRLANLIDERVTAILIRKSAINRLLIGSHRLFVRFLEAVKHRMCAS